VTCPRMEALLPMSPERLESLSSLPPPDASVPSALSQPTPAYPAKIERVSPARLPAATLPAPTLPSTLQESVPNSQESHVSSSSKGSDFLRLASESSNASPQSAESTSPHSLHGPFTQTVNRVQRPLTPDIHHVSKSSSDGAQSNSVSPTAVDAQHLKHGSKRTASGAVKSTTNAYLSNSPPYHQQQPNLSAFGGERNPIRIAEVSFLVFLAHTHANHS
jgi:hypothetical protein